MSKKYDVIIVGAGPAGIFSALELSKNLNNIRILIVEKGKDITKRICPMKVKDIACTACPECAILSGWGGAGAFSDGKLTLSTEVGGWLGKYINDEERQKLMDYVDQIYIRFGAPNNVYGDESDKVEEIERRASLASLKLVQQRVRHMGTEKCAETLRKMRSSLNDQIEVKTKCEVKGLIARGEHVEGVETVD